MKRKIAFHPPLAAIYTPVALYAANVSLIPLRDVLIPTLFCLGGSLALWAIGWLLLRDGLRSAAVTSALIFAFFAYGPIDDAMRRSMMGDAAFGGRALPLGLWVAAAVALAIGAGWKSRHQPALATFLNTVGSIACLFAIGTVVKAQLVIRSELSRPNGNAAASDRKAIGHMPDIFYIVLDGYGRTDTFERLYGFSDREFVSWLEESGFYVAPKAHSNYVQTELSLASSLNMKPVEGLAHRLGNAANERLVLDSRIDENAVARRLKQLGYRYFAITSGFPALTFDSADVVVRSDTGASLFAQALMLKTPIRPSREGVDSMYEARRSYLRGAFRALERLAAPTASPKFVVTHVLAPHPPFVFGPDGEPRRPKKGPFGYWDGSHFEEMIAPLLDYRAGYRDQATYIAKLTQKAVDAILTASKGEAIVLIQGDHGPKSGLDQSLIEKTDLKEAFSILAAFHVPESIRSRIPEDATPINTFGLILSGLTGEPYTMQPSRSYYSSWEEPLKFIDVTARLKP